MVNAKKEYRRALMGSFTWKGKYYSRGELVPFVNFEEECPGAFKSNFSGAMDKDGRPIGSGAIRRRKVPGEHRLSTSRFRVEDSKERYCYNIFDRESGELMNEEPIHKTAGVRALLAQLEG